MSKRVLVFVYIVVVCYEGTVRSSFLSANTFFYILSPAPLVSFWHGQKTLLLNTMNVKEEITLKYVWKVLFH